MDRQTYFPGTPDIGSAREILIAPGQKVPDMDFALNEVSFGRAFTAADSTIPLVLNVEGGGPLPLSGGGRVMAVAFKGPDGRTWSITVIDPPFSFVFVSAVQAGALRVVVENLPARYAVKSITYGSADLLTNPLEFVRVDSVAPAGMLQPLIPRVISESRAIGRAIPYTPLTLTLSRVAPPPKTGVRVSGRLSSPPKEHQTVYLSNIPGDLYLDGTFEVFGVPPGRHSTITRNNPSDAYPFGASVVVRDRDVENVLLEETPLTPLANREPPPPLPTGNRPDGNVPLARIAGTIVEDGSRQAVTDGAVVIKSGMFYSESFPLDADGRFEIPALLPGSYELEVQAFGHTTVKRSVELDDQEINVDFVVRRVR